MNKKIKPPRLWRYFILMIVIGFLVTVVFQSSLIVLISDVFQIEGNIKTIVIIILVGIILGIATTILISKKYFEPISKLSAEMKKVAQGNFDIEIRTDSKVKAIRDIYSDFNLMVKELNATETLQSDFVSNVSHEIKTPVAAIEGYATLLQGCDSLNSDQKIYIDKIIYNTSRLSELVGNILLLSKVDNKAIQSVKTDFRLDEQIRQSIVFLEPKWSKKEIEFDVEMDEITFTGNKELMIHIWNNLIDNAIKFSAAQGLIKISLKKHNGAIEFIISDTGPGISENDKKHIFNKFYQCDSSHKSEGNGLGLSLVKNILNLINGEITVYDNNPHGAIFKIMLY